MKKVFILLLAGLLASTSLAGCADLTAPIGGVAGVVPNTINRAYDMAPDRGADFWDIWDDSRVEAELEVTGFYNSITPETFKDASYEAKKAFLEPLSHSVRTLKATADRFVEAGLLPESVLNDLDITSSTVMVEDVKTMAADWQPLYNLVEEALLRSDTTVQTVAAGEVDQNLRNSGFDDTAPGGTVLAQAVGFDTVGRDGNEKAILVISIDGIVLYEMDQCGNWLYPVEPKRDYPDTPRLNPKDPTKDILVNPELPEDVQDTTGPGSGGDGHQVSPNPENGSGNGVTPAPDTSVTVPDDQIYAYTTWIFSGQVNKPGNGGYTSYEVWSEYFVYKDGHSEATGKTESRNSVWYPDAKPPQDGDPSDEIFEGDPGE